MKLLFTYFPVSFSLLDPNIIPSNPFSNILTLCP
jgi:hypothetical protein